MLYGAIFVLFFVQLYYQFLLIFCLKLCTFNMHNMLVTNVGYGEGSSLDKDETVLKTKMGHKIAFPASLSLFILIKS